MESSELLPLCWGFVREGYRLNSFYASALLLPRPYAGDVCKRFVFKAWCAFVPAISYDTF